MVDHFKWALVGQTKTYVTMNCPSSDADVKSKKVEETTRQPGHHHTEAHSVYHRESRTHQTHPDGIHVTQASFRRGCQVPKECTAGWPTTNRLTRHQACTGRANIAVRYEPVSHSKHVSKSEGSSHVLWRPTSCCCLHTNEARHKSHTHANATGTEYPPDPIPANYVRRPPTAID